MSAAFPEWPSPHRRCAHCLELIAVEELVQSELDLDRGGRADWDTPIAHPEPCLAEWRKLPAAQKDVREKIKYALADNRRAARDERDRANGTHQYFHDIFVLDRIGYFA